MTGFRRVFALWLAACGASADGHVRLPAPLDDTGRLLADDAADTRRAASPVPCPVFHPVSVASPRWVTGPQVGHGVAFKDTKNSAGEDMFIGYAGYRVDLASAEAWVEALHEASLAGRGVRYLWAVQGPNERTYSNFEIGNSQVVSTILPLVGPKTRFIVVAGHSSGSFVAHELLGRLAGGMDPRGVTSGRIVYFDLDGGASGLTPSVVGRLRRAYFIGAHDGNNNTDSPRQAEMRALGAAFASAGGYWQSDAGDSGCHPGAQWCVHDALITSKPHAPTNASSQLDYSDFAGRHPCHSWIDAKADEAGLQP